MFVLRITHAITMYKSYNSENTQKSHASQLDHFDGDGEASVEYKRRLMWLSRRAVLALLLVR